MSYCLNPRCLEPQNTHNENFCVSCGSKLLLKERYRAIRPIGHGGFGRTFLAVDEDKPSQPQCVIKQLHPQSQGTSTLNKALQLFTQEAMRLDELGKHPQIPELLAYFTQDDRHYLLQEFIRGNNLAEELKQSGIFQEELIIELLLDLLPVLQFCHSKQVIHRDIKPANLMVGNSDNRVVVLDFGAVKEIGTVPGTRIGAEGYCAPEQERGQPLIQSDLYAIGPTLIFLTTGENPFKFYRQRGRSLKFDVSGIPTITPELREIIDRVTEPLPRDRIQSAKELISALEGCK